MNENGSWLTDSPNTPTQATKPIGPVGKIRPSLADTIHVSLRGRVGNTIDYYSYPSGTIGARFRMAVSKKAATNLTNGMTWEPPGTPCAPGAN